MQGGSCPQPEASSEPQRAPPRRRACALRTLTRAGLRGGERPAMRKLPPPADAVHWHGALRSWEGICAYRLTGPLRHHFQLRTLFSWPDFSAWRHGKFALHVQHISC